MSTAPVVEIWDFIEKLETPGDCAIAPLVYIHEKTVRRIHVLVEQLYSKWTE